jgi:uncharacterized protein
MRASALALVATLAGSAAIPPAPTRWVEDRAAFLSPPTRAALDAKLEAYERATGHQIVVWIGKTLEGAPLDDWAVRAFAAWKVGRAGLDDGIAMFVLADDRAIDIEVGYGLEDKVPDAIASRIINDVMTPRMRVGDRDGAVTAGVDALLSAIEGQPWSGATGGSRLEKISTAQWIVGGLVAVALIALLIKHPRLGLFLLWMIASSWRRNGRGMGGGFGGGGGRSGGGGARGTW